MATKKKRRTPPRGKGGQFVSRKRKKSTGTRKRATAKRKTVKRKTVKRKATRRAPVARKRRRTTKRRRSSGVQKYTPVRGKIYRRNPKFSIQGLLKKLPGDLMNAGTVVAGKAGARVVANFLPLPKDGIMNYVTQVVAALGVGIAAKQFLNAKQAEFVMAGALSAPVETFLKGLPVIGPFLGDDELLMGEYLSMGELPIGEYPAMGEELPIGEYVQY